MLLGVLVRRSRTTCIRLEVFSFIDCELRETRSVADRHQCLFGSLATLQIVICSLDRVNVSRLYWEVIPPQAHIASPLVQRDDDKCNSLRSSKNRFGLAHPRQWLMVETRPILLEDHLYVYTLVRIQTT